MHVVRLKGGVLELLIFEELPDTLAFLPRIGDNATTASHAIRTNFTLLRQFDVRFFLIVRLSHLFSFIFNWLVLFI